MLILASRNVLAEKRNVKSEMRLNEKLNVPSSIYTHICLVCAHEFNETSACCALCR